MRRCVTLGPVMAPPVVSIGPDSNCPGDPGYPALRRGRVSFAVAGVSLDVELAETVADQNRGLMYRTDLNDDEGMLFVFGQRSVHTFWMKNTCMALDLLFLDEDGFVVGIKEDAKPMDRSDLWVPCPSAYVLEVNGGWSRRHGIRPGMTAEIQR